MIPIVEEARLRAILGEFKSRVSARLGGRLARIVLFGSYARGTVSEESDIDILVLVHEFRRDDLSKVAEEAAALMIRHQAVLSPLCLDLSEYQRLLAMERALALDVEREGVTL